MEIKMLAFSIVLGLLHLFAAVHLATKKRGIKWNLSSRDIPQAPLDGLAGRLDRASNNFRETFVFFASAVLATQLLGISNSMTVWGSQIYLLSRVVYFFLYAFDVTVVRSIVWLFSTIGIVMVLSALF
jgi:uncharacterized MAPEG superfamily protein